MIRWFPPSLIGSLACRLANCRGRANGSQASRLNSPLFLLALLFPIAGCHVQPHVPPTASGPALEGLSPQYIAVLQALCTPPANWVPEPLKHSESHDHQVWLSPTGHAAYGVIHFKLPLPIGHDLALWGFLRQMRETEGEAVLISKKWDPNLLGPQIRSRRRAIHRADKSFRPRFHRLGRLCGHSSGLSGGC